MDITHKELHDLSLCPWLRPQIDTNSRNKGILNVTRSDVAVTMG